jgi:beta-lactamase superfamily II metal-dependent hydrolase
VAGTSVVQFSPDIRLDVVVARLHVVVAADRLTSPVPDIDINDTSIVLGLRVGNVRALFTGDLNHRPQPRRALSV